ncbi:substrate-binding domain-containing protein, partial [Streptococcus agalactiae]
IKGVLDAAGAKYISADAQSSAAKQLTDIESLISQGADAIIVLAQDSEAVGPAVAAAVAEGIPVVGYDRLIENPDAFYLTFDNKEVGRLQAAGVYAVQPTGNYVFIKGNSADPNADFLFEGQMEVLK